MKGILYYYSVSGNTKLVCQSIVDRMKGDKLELCDIYSDTRPNPDKYAITGFAFPTHYFGLPHAFNTFVRTLSAQPGKPAFLINTFGMMQGETLRLAERLVNGKGFRVVAWHALNMPENYPPFIAKGWTSKDKPDGKQLAAFGTFIKDLGSIIDRLGRNEAVLESRVKVDFFNKLMRSKPREKVVKEIGRFTIDPMRCSRCGACAERCPAGAIRMNPIPEHDLGLCAGCWSCFNQCERNAISTEKISASSGYYRPDTTLAAKLRLPE